MEPQTRIQRTATRLATRAGAAVSVVAALLVLSTALFVARPGLAGAVLGPQQEAAPAVAQFGEPPAWALAPAAPRPDCRYFPETQHNLCYGFRSYWETFGGLLEFGYPLTEEYVDPVLGRTVQWFERARFEWHPGAVPDRFDVLQGRLGAELLGIDGLPPAPGPAPTPTPTPTPSPTPAPGVTIDLTPASDTNAIGTLHTVTATVEEDGAPVQGARVRFVVTGGGNPSPTTGNALTNNIGQARFSFSNTVASTNTVEAWVDLDGDSVRDADEPVATATKTWTGTFSIELTPSTSTNATGTDHTVTAAVTRDGDPVSGVRVRFLVTGGGDVSPVSGTDVTDADGEATFTFSNEDAVSNTVEAWIDLDNDGVRDSGEPMDTATKTWVSASLSLEGLGPAVTVDSQSGFFVPEQALAGTSDWDVDVTCDLSPNLTGVRVLLRFTSTGGATARWGSASAATSGTVAGTTSGSGAQFSADLTLADGDDSDSYTVACYLDKGTLGSFDSADQLLASQRIFVGTLDFAVTDASAAAAAADTTADGTATVTATYASDPVQGVRVALRIEGDGGTVDDWSFASGSDDDQEAGMTGSAGTFSRSLYWRADNGGAGLDTVSDAFQGGWDPDQDGAIEVHADGSPADAPGGIS